MSPPDYPYTSQNSQYTFTSVYSLCNRWEKGATRMYGFRYKKKNNSNVKYKRTDALSLWHQQ